MSSNSSSAAIDPPQPSLMGAVGTQSTGATRSAASGRLGAGLYQRISNRSWHSLGTTCIGNIRSGFNRESNSANTLNTSEQLGRGVKGTNWRSGETMKTAQIGDCQAPETRRGRTEQDEDTPRHDLHGRLPIQTRRAAFIFFCPTPSRSRNPTILNWRPLPWYTISPICSPDPSARCFSDTCGQRGRESDRDRIRKDTS